jgi:hypothetical protein
MQAKDIKCCFLGCIDDNGMEQLYISIDGGKNIYELPLVLTK